MRRAEIEMERERERKVRKKRGRVYAWAVCYRIKESWEKATTEEGNSQRDECKWKSPKNRRNKEKEERREKKIEIQIRCYFHERECIMKQRLKLETVRKRQSNDRCANGISIEIYPFSPLRERKKRKEKIERENIVYETRKIERRERERE